VPNENSAGDDRHRLLADGRAIPILGLGVWQVSNGPECEHAVRWALESGYRQIDTAQAYGNEESVGRALRDSGVPREEVFITTKFYPARRDPAAEVQNSLRRLGVEQVDLYIVHWPQRGPTWAWPGMEAARERGYARSIGVSNYSASELEQVVAVASSPPVINQVQFSPFEYRRALRQACEQHNVALEAYSPVINQVQFSPFEYRRALRQACEQHNVALEAYSPLGTGRHLSNRTVGEIAAGLGRTPAQVLLRWCIQRQTIVLPKSTHRERIEENARVFDFSLSDKEMATLDRLDRTGGTATARERKWW
jgi:diketogulonate reductase-like aldo/keto reductase